MVDKISEEKSVSTYGIDINIIEMRLRSIWQAKVWMHLTSSGETM